MWIKQLFIWEKKKTWHAFAPELSHLAPEEQFLAKNKKEISAPAWPSDGHLCWKSNAPNLWAQFPCLAGRTPPALPISPAGRTAPELERGPRVFGQAAVEPVHCVRREAGYLLREFITHFKMNWIHRLEVFAFSCNEHTAGLQRERAGGCPAGKVPASEALFSAAPPQSEDQQVRLLWALPRGHQPSHTSASATISSNNKRTQPFSPFPPALWANPICSSARGTVLPAAFPSKSLTSRSVETAPTTNLLVLEDGKGMCAASRTRIGRAGV